MRINRAVFASSCVAALLWGVAVLHTAVYYLDAFWTLAAASLAWKTGREPRTAIIRLAEPVRP